MRKPNQPSPRGPGAEIVDFDEVLLRACPDPVRAQLLWEAELLASAFAPSRNPAALERMAVELSAGHRDGELGRHHARRLAAALKRLARAA